jgi:hypothetical protein
MALTTVFSYVLCPQEYIILPVHIPEYGDAFAVVAMILGPLVRMVMGYVCGEKVRNIAWVVLWACVGRFNHVILVSVLDNTSSSIANSIMTTK